GKPAVDVTVMPASAAGGTTFGAVLVIDASESMRGKPLAAAMNAARAFVARRNPRQKIAVVTFNAQPMTTLPFTTSASEIDSALSKAPPVAYGTHIYDAVATAQALLEKSKIDAGSIVVLSDGAGTASTQHASAVTAQARADHVQVFSIGLRSSKFDSSSLTKLAAATGGEYRVAETTAGLTPLFDELGARLASEYLVRYKSLVGPEQAVKV